MPQRFLRPGIRTSERWNAVSRNAQALYLAILTLVDDYGRYEARISILHADAFAVWNELNPSLAVTPQETAALRSELQTKNLMDVYEFEGKQFLQLTQWYERARGKSKFPEPSAGIRSVPQESAAKSCLPSPSHRHESSPSPIPAAPVNSEHQAFIKGWCENFEKVHKVKYQFEEGRDGKAVKELLKMNILRIDLLEIAKKAWAWKGNLYLSGRSLTIHGFKENFNAINTGTTNGNPHSKTTSLNPAADRRNAGTIGNTDYGAAAVKRLAKQEADGLARQSPPNGNEPPPA